MVVVGWLDLLSTYWGPTVVLVYSSLTRALAEALADVLWFVDSSEDEQMDPDDAVKVLEGVAHVVGKLSGDQRNELVDLLGKMVEAEPDPERREFLAGLPEGFGFLDDAA
ncbi:hypothetical protein [Streptomyces pratensis]|uniref:hypothetical protein n=1 Tax=Streptomyces pratensis TaxID=1169025 RepID=UPI001EE3F960|nr:hypothetical protein [Streptomyces pratensis]